MREYTTIPNVFRLESLQTMNNNASTSYSNNNKNKNNYGYNYDDGNATANQQLMIITATTSIATTSTTTVTSDGMATTTQAIVHNGGECNSVNNNNDVGAASENVAIRINYPHKLKAVASIERHCNAAESNADQRIKAHLPYATLPRGITLNNNHNNNSEHMGIIANGNLRIKMSANQKPISSTAVDDERIINTISGSIPSTGYTGNLTTATNNNNQPNSNNNNINNNNNSSLDQSGSVISDLDISFTDFSQLNSIEQQQHLMPMRDYRLLQTEQQHQQQQHHYQSSRGLSNKSPFQVSLDRKNYNHNNNNSYLWILTPVAASISVAIVIAALAGPQWLFTEERLPNANYNGTANFNALDDGAYITKYTKSSLWILCTTMQGVETYNCIKIDYFPKEGYQPEAHDSTSAIPYTVRKSAPLFLVSGFFLLISFIVYLIPTCSHQNSLYYFSAGIMFIVSGLFMLIGLITYISTLKAEIGSKLRPRSTLQPALLKVTYGQSFFLYVFGFVATEFVGVLNIFLYISLQEIGYYSRLPCLTFANLREKIKEGQHPYKHQYQLHHADTLPSMGSDQKPLPRRMRQVHNTSTQLLGATNNSEWNEEKVQLSSTLGCRKHPQGPDANALFNNDLERRFYFEKSANKCNLHSKNLAKSLNELYDEATNKATMAAAATTASTITNTPANVINEAQLRQQQLHAQYHHQQQHHQHQQQQHQQHHNLLQLTNLPQEFPLTRSISTTTELFANSNYGNGNGNGNYRVPTTPTALSSASTAITKATNRLMADHHPTYQEAADQEEDQYNEDVAEPQRLCGIKRSSIRRTKDDIFQDFCKRAGVRPKPKNIYYIASEEEQALALRHQLQAKPKTETLREVDEQLYAIEDSNQQHLQHNPLSRNTRRASMFVEPLHFRKLANSNLSLHTSTLYAPEVEHCAAINNIRPLYARGLYGGSQTQLHQHEASNISRTLPRSFLKQQRYNGDSQDSMFGSTSLHASNVALHSQHYQQHLQQQQQQQSQATMGHFQPASAHLLQPLLTLHKSCEKLNVGYPMVQQQQQHQQLSPQVTVQWPAAIPSSPANFNSAKFQLYSPTPAVAAPTSQQLTHALLSRSGSSGAGVVAAAGATPKFQRTYAPFDDQRRPTVVHSDTFDLDEIERERRRSHANLLGVMETPKNGNNSSSSSNEQYDLINGTAV